MSSKIKVNAIEPSSGSQIKIGAGVTVSAGIITATTFSGNATLATNAQGLSGTPDITVRNITGVAATFTGSVSIGGTLTYEDVTNVDSVGIVTAAQFVPTSGQNVSRNIVINGNFNVNQRATSANNANGIHTTDRWAHWFGNTSVTTWTQRVQDTTPGADAPAGEGHRKYFEVVKSDAGSVAVNGYSNFQYHIEASDLACSGWDHKSATSYLTLSFWVRQSAASQTFYGQIRTDDGTAQKYTFAFTADATWRKVTVTIPGNSNITIDNDNGKGATIWIAQWMGTDYTTSGHTLNAWGAYSGSDQCPDMANGYLTSTAWFRIAGVQLEVGSVATPFDHRSYADEFMACQRYFRKYGGAAAYQRVGIGYFSNTSRIECPLTLAPVMRTTPIMTVSDAGHWKAESPSGSGAFTAVGIDGNSSKEVAIIWGDKSNTFTAGESGRYLANNTTSARIFLSAELS